MPGPNFGLMSLQGAQGPSLPGRLAGPQPSSGPPEPPVQPPDPASGKSGLVSFLQEIPADTEPLIRLPQSPIRHATESHGPITGQNRQPGGYGGRNAELPQRSSGLVPGNSRPHGVDVGYPPNHAFSHEGHSDVPLAPVETKEGSRSDLLVDLSGSQI